MFLNLKAALLFLLNKSKFTLTCFGFAKYYFLNHVCFLQGGLGDSKSQTLPVKASLSEQTGTGGTSTEIQRSPDGSEDEDSSQSKFKLLVCCL